jgi:CRISPR-associated exonuclease Cas4
VEDLAALMHRIMQSGHTPPPVYAKRCESCSMFPVCLPKAIESASASRYLARALEGNLSQTTAQDHDKDGHRSR